MQYFLNEESESVLTDTLMNFMTGTLIGYLNSNLMLKWVSPFKSASTSMFLFYPLFFNFIYVMKSSEN